MKSGYKKGEIILNLKFAEYIKESLKDKPNDRILLTYQKKILTEGEEAEKRVRNAGLDDDKIILDLLKSEHQNLGDDYEAFRKAEKRRLGHKSMHKFFLIGTPIYMLVMVLIYLVISFATHRWRETWLMIITFVCAWTDFAAVYFAKEISEHRRAFHVFARVILALAVVFTSVAVYLHFLMLHNFENSWIIVPAGVAAMFCVDALFATLTKQSLKIINFLLYIPAGFAMLFIVLCGLHVIAWNVGWLLVILAVIIDIFVVIGALAAHRKYVYRPEAENK